MLRRWIYEPGVRVFVRLELSGLMTKALRILNCKSKLDIYNGVTLHVWWIGDGHGRPLLGAVSWLCRSLPLSRQLHLKIYHIEVMDLVSIAQHSSCFGQSKISSHILRPSNGRDPPMDAISPPGQSIASHLPWCVITSRTAV